MHNGPIPEQVIEAVLKHHDIVDVVRKYVHLTRHGRNLKGLCPFHSEKTPSFTVNPEKQIFKCFGCGAGGNVIAFLRDIEGYTFSEAVRQLAEEAGIPVGWEERSPEQAGRQREIEQLRNAYEFASMLYHHLLINTKQGKPAMQYLRSRGITDTLIETFQIGYAPAGWDTLAQMLAKRNYDLPLMEKGGLLSAKSSGGFVDKFRDRVMFPIRDAKGRVIAFAGRSLGNEQPKYLNSPETILFRKSKVLYNFHLARPAIKKTSQIVLLEGYVDVIKAWAAGIHNGVATMGTALTDDHARYMRLSAERIVLCYDGDDAGQSASYKNAAILEQAGLEVKVSVLPNKLDPDEYISKFGAERFAGVLEAALPVNAFRLHHLRKNFNLTDPGAKPRYIRAALREVIAGIGSPTEREYYLKELAAEFGIDLQTLKQETHEIRLQMQKKRQFGDNNGNSWNTDMNDGSDAVPLPKPAPAHHKAERHLLYLMMHDKELADYVRHRLGDAFHDEAHAALAAYLYAYYAQGRDSDPRQYMATLQDERLEQVACAILMTESDRGVNGQVIEDYIRQIEKHRQEQQIEQMEARMKDAERNKDFIRAAQILKEITTLRNQLNSV